MNFLLFRGLVRDQRHWFGFPDTFRKKLPEAKLHFLDFPGTGTESARPSPNSIPEIRADLARRFHEKVASGEFPTGPWNLVAISLGGMVAMDWVASEPDTFERFVLINSSARDCGSFFERFTPRILPEVARALVDFRPEVSERLILKYTSNRMAELRDTEKQMIEWQRQNRVSRQTFLAQISAGARFCLPGKPKPKTVVIHSLGDRLVSPEMSRRIASRFGVETRVHPWAGHDLSLDDPEWLAEQIANFVKT